jgi:hypothetical protein
MALRIYNVTLGAAATQAATAVIPLVELHIESETGNADVLVGDSGVSATDYGLTVTAGPTNAKTMGPFPTGILSLNDVYFLGTENEIIHLAVITP